MVYPVVTVHSSASATITVAGKTFTSDATGNTQHSMPWGIFSISDSVSGQSFECTIGRDTTKIYVMPEGALYWYGNECTWITSGWSTPRTRLNINGGTYIGKLGVKNTNYLSNQHNGNSQCFDGFETVDAIDCSGYSKLNTKSKRLGSDPDGLAITIANNTGTLNKGESIFGIQRPTSTNVVLTTSNRLLSDTLGYGVFVIAETSVRNYALYAMWLE